MDTAERHRADDTALLEYQPNGQQNHKRKHRGRKPRSPFGQELERFLDGKSVAWLAEAAGYHDGYLCKLVTATGKLPSQRVLERCGLALGQDEDEAASITEALRRAAFPDPGPTKPEPRPIVPAQVPAPRPALVGAPLQHLEKTGRHSVLIDGPPGVGKRAWARYWAHRIRPSYSDGQLYADLTQQTPREVLDSWLRTLELADNVIPTTLSGLVTLWRSVSCHRRMVVVIEAALDTEQVRSLLPAGVNNAVVVTSRRRLASLRADTGAVHVSLSSLSPREARELLQQELAGHPVSSDEQVLDRIAGLCDRLPRALHAAADRLTSQPRGNAFLDDLAVDPLGALGACDHDQSLAEALREHVDGVRCTGNSRHATALRFLAYYPEATTPSALSALLGTTECDALRLADDLVAHHMLAVDSSGRYRVPSLLARSVRDRTNPDSDDLRQAGARWCRWWLYAARAVDERLNGTAHQREELPVGVVPPRIDDRHAAWQWCAQHAAELPQVISSATAVGMTARVGEYVAALEPYLVESQQLSKVRDETMTALQGVLAAQNAVSPVDRWASAGVGGGHDRSGEA